MTINFGSGVTRTLDPRDRAFSMLVWQYKKPPLHSEWNLLQQVELERTAQHIRSLMPSGFLLDPTRSEFDFVVNPSWVNHFHLGDPRDAHFSFDGPEKEPCIWANVNGYIIPVAGTDIVAAAQPEDDPLYNVVKLSPPPETDGRVDMVYLEVWQAVVQPNPSTVHKPTASTIWKYGNVKYGGTNLADDLEDPAIGVETTKRVQVQYAIRVFGSGGALGQGVNLEAHPDGIDDPNITAQGAASAAVAGYTFSNMREELGDAGLWRAGNGDAQSVTDLGTVDGYVYAIPICAVFRRNSAPYVAALASGDPNQNGSTYLRWLTAVTPANATVLTDATLDAVLDAVDGVSLDTTIAVSGLSGSGFDTVSLASNFYAMLDNEIVQISAINVTGGTITIPAGGRGRWGTAVVGHAANTRLAFFNNRPDGAFADEVRLTDILDLRHGVNPGDWDYDRLLRHNVAALVQGTLRSTWKQSNPGDTEGPVIHEVDDIWAAGTAVPNHTDPVDGPDGIRTVWSDGASLQPDVTVLCQYDASSSGGLVGFTNPNFDAVINWEVGATLQPIGFINNANEEVGWSNGSCVHLFIGGSDGNSGARATVRGADNKVVRFITPKEFWKTGYPITDPANGQQHPVRIRLYGEAQTESYPPGSGVEQDWFPGPLYPWQADGFHTPFIVLGGLLDSQFDVENVDVANLVTVAGPPAQIEIDLTAYGFNFNASFLQTEFGPQKRTLQELLTANLTDRTGNQSQLYVVLFGDEDHASNNGAFRVIGMGTSGVTDRDAQNTGSIVIEALSEDFDAWSDTGNLIRVQFRTMDHHPEDICNYSAKQADLCVVFTDIGGQAQVNRSLDTPWGYTNLGAGAAGSTILGTDSGGRYYSPNHLLLNLTMMYEPGRSGTARVADSIDRFGGRGNSGARYLRQARTLTDPSFTYATDGGLPETYWDPIHVQTWNRLPALGWDAPMAPEHGYGGNVIGFTEIDREHELFVDRGSKSFIFRPFQSKALTIKALTYTEDQGLAADECLLGNYEYPSTDAKDAFQILTGGEGVDPQETSGKRMGFPVPREYMPRFGRQDIPYYQLPTGTSPLSDGWLPGINHLFKDVTDVTTPVFNVIGGRPNLTGGNAVFTMELMTNTVASGGKTYGQLETTFTTNGAYMARKTTSISDATTRGKAVVDALAAVSSSDLGKGLMGIQLPPYIGLARLMGVYEHTDYDNKSGRTFESNRWQVMADPATNLIREDVDQQTLFILQDGAQDLTDEDGDHTYIIPTNVLDLRRIPTYNEGDEFDDFHYVVVAEVFYFAKNWINENNLVLLRRYNGQGEGAGGAVSNIDGANPTLDGILTCIPAAAGYNDRFYVAYNRTAYQGDPYGTRDASTYQIDDYEARYGRLTPAQEYLLRTVVQQFDSSGNFVPETPNKRAFEVLSSLDFYTTLGTGKMGGQLYPGTPLDVGFIENTAEAATRLPASSSDTPWSVSSRAFTEGQGRNTNRASLVIDLLDHDDLVTGGGNLTVTIVTQDGTTQFLFNASANPAAVYPDFYEGTTLQEAALNLAAAINGQEGLVRTVTARAVDRQVILTAVPTGIEGNLVQVYLNQGDPTVLVSDVANLLVEHGQGHTAVYTTAYLTGGTNLVVNAGNGRSVIDLTGMTERLPLGVLLQDSDFLCENPLNDNASSMKTSPAGIRPVHNDLPLTTGGEEFTRFLGEPGALFVMADGKVAPYSAAAYTPSFMGGTKRFRLYRGGGSVFMLSGINPGGPLDWVADSIPASLNPVLKGGVLACRAMLVRNYYEEASVPNPFKTTDGDEIQLVVLTYGHFGDPSVVTKGIPLDGVISPSGYGEGYAAADRYRVKGRPMMKAFNRETPPMDEVQIAAYPETERS